MNLSIRWRDVLAVCVLTTVFATPSFASEKTALDKYVAKPDPNYSYKVVNTLRGDGATAYVLEMVSQKWLTEQEVDRPIWKHWVTIIKPDEVSSKTGLLFITGGGNDRPAPQQPDQNLMRVATGTKSVVTELRMVPNQPLVFAGETKGRSEDSLIAYTWDKYLRTGDEKWPARLPMTKSAVRAMDTVTAFCASEEAGKTTVDKFVVAGASKRGWTTWTTGAVDKRVVAIVPIVIDMLNVVPSFKHHFDAYGFWAPAVGDYEHAGIMDWQDTPQYAALMKIEEPFEYRDRLTMPKLLINSAGDQFFLPDSSQFYWKDLPGPKYIRYVPNSDHSLKNTDALASLLSFHDAIIHGKALPSFTWDLPEPGVIRIETKTKPGKVKLWRAVNPNARDFRLESIGPAYVEQELQPESDGKYVAKVEKPEKGFAAGFVELTFDNQPAPFKFTSGVTVIPNTLPFAGKFVPHPPGTASGK
jgi:PhoPQ-activated pathogenicity-related protein